MSAPASIHTRRPCPSSSTLRTTPTPSTWPWPWCPPSGSPARSAGSRFTRAPAVRPPSDVRASVSGTASNAIRPSVTSTAVRQQPSIETESPTAVAAAVAGASISSRTPPSWPAMPCVRPTSFTIPVNIVSLSSLSVGQGFERLADEHLEVAPLAGEGIAERNQELLDGGSLAGRELHGADLLDPLAQLVVPERAHEPLRQQADELVVGALEVGGR